jgi:hypothetical protein
MRIRKDIKNVMMMHLILLKLITKRIQNVMQMKKMELMSDCQRSIKMMMVTT